MFPIIVFILLSIAVSYFVVSPIVQARGRQGGFSGKSNHHANDLVERKETIYAAIKDIEFDYQMGKLSEEDFKELRQKYKDEAVGLLKTIDKGQTKPAKGEGTQVSKSQRKTEDQSVNFCWECGMAVAADDNFCANCGNKVSE